MKRWRAKILLLAGVSATLGLAIPAAGQREPAAESQLPPGFGDPADTPAAGETPAPGTPADPAAPAPEDLVVDDSAPAPRRGIVPDAMPAIEDSAAEDLQDLAALDIPPPIEIPDEARRPTNVVGPLTADNWGLGYDAFGNANGALLASLMRRLDAPLPSRWASMLLRRALLSQIPAPSYVQDVDWVAERAWLLLRMGEADAARALVQSVDVDRFTPRMFTVAVQTALATADPAGLCPLVGPGREISDEPVWPLAAAMCAALEGDAAQASSMIDQARRRSGAGTIDVSLAEKIVGAGANTRRAVTIEWDQVDSLNSWRFGIASATGLSIPQELMRGAGRHVLAWQARAPMVPLADRAAAADTAAALGVFSHAALIDIYSLLGDQTDVSELEGTIAGRLRRAYTGRTVQERLDAMNGLWDEGEGGEAEYAHLILTATAAAQIRPSAERENDVDELLGSMLSAGLDRAAGGWGGVVDGLGSDADRAWSLLAVATDKPTVDVSAGRAEAFAESAGGHRGRMLVAALAGLGRLEDPAALGVNPAPRTRWANMIRLAADRQQPGTVALLAAVGMQTPDWRGVPPEHLYHVLRALTKVGLGYEARMIAAEAMTRL
jgi:hypothetical protein